MSGSKSDTRVYEGSAKQVWPTWAKRLATAVLVFHVAAVLAGSVGAPPASPIEQSAANLFAPYHQLVDQGDAYRFYSTAFPPTPVIMATLHFKDGRDDQVVRIPDPATRPRLLYQRQLAMAHFLMEDFNRERDAGDGSKSRWAHAYATYLGKSHPGCSSVTLRVESHLVPRLERVQDLLRESGNRPVNLQSDEFITAPERIGDYPCDAS